jgi:ubiquinone/menaquinone biosynthesis C-methylase UbiE
MVEHLREYFSACEGGDILDVATGKGDFIDVLKTVFKSFDVIIGVDGSRRVLQGARTRFPEENIMFVRQDCYRLDFPAHSFHHISIANSLHHFEHVDRCLAEISRVLKEDGKVIITETFNDTADPDQLAGIKVHDFFAGIDRALGFEHRCLFSKQEIFDLLDGSKLRPVHDFIAGSHVQPGADEAERAGRLLERRLKQVRAHPNGAEFREKAEQVREWLDHAKMVPLSTLVIIAGNSSN